MSLIILIAVIGVACGSAATPTAPTAPAATSASGKVTTGVFASGQVQLSYRLDIPAHTAPIGAVVFGHGSGLQTKDSCRIFGLADGFVARGYATLCFDKRGVGQSTGQYMPAFPQNSAAVFDDLSDDIAAGVQFLRNRPEIDPHRVGLAGASQAGWILPLAAQKSNAAFMLINVGPTVSYGLENFYSSIVEITNAPVEDGYKALPSFTGIHGFDPKPVLESLNVPGLWLLGGDDRSIPTPATVAILEQLIAAGKPYSHVVFPGMGHNLPPSWPHIDAWLAKIGK
ncbi:MAG TPA: alpha/beta hydrolase [Vicinamibacterales bacterium]|nr:alpha/beta hydrolase [Vicinamibacterales bacterium]